MATSDNALRITYNGEIYNFRNLRRELEQKGVRFRTTTDTEVLLELFRLEGPHFLRSLRGMFAFALWDGTKKSLFLARDPFGIKPLYFSDDGRTLRFASQVKALVASQDIDKALSPAGQVGFFLWGHVPEPYTIYRSIRSLPPGHAMMVSAGARPKIWKYHDLLAELARDGCRIERYGADASGQEVIRSAVKETVAHHMVADVPVGCFLSAGIDSNVLCANAARLLDGHQLECITLGFEEYLGSSEDEVPLAMESAIRLGVNHRVRKLGYAEFEGEISRLLDFMDQPSIDGVNTYFVAKAAAETGLKVALSGVGADELFGGYPSFAQVPRLVAACKWVPFAPRVGAAIRHFLTPLVGNTTSAKYASLLEYGHAFPEAYFLRRALFMPWELRRILDTDVVKAGLEELRTLDELRERLSSISTPYARVMAAEIMEYLQPCLLRDADWAGMAHSVEIRTPYVDAYFFQQLARLMKDSRRAPSKRDLAACSNPPLASQIVKRGKTGFTVPVNAWLKKRVGAQAGGRGLRSWAKVVARHFGIEVQQSALRTPA